MRNTVFNKSIAFFLTFIFLFGLIPSAGFAQPNPPQINEIRGFNRSAFDNNFSKADREINPEIWLSEAKFGIKQSMYAWELLAGSLYDDPLLLEEAKRSLEKWSNEELELRFSQWLTGRFFGEAAEKAIMNFASRLGETQKKYSWQLDDDGNVIFDTQSGDPLIIRPGDEGREFAQDILLWQRDTENLLKDGSLSLDTVISGLYPELLAYIPEELRETMSAVIYNAGINAAGMIKREFENIAAREERIFTSRRTRDIWSLRKQNENESARLFTEKLIAETDESCKKGIEEITAKVEAASAGTGDLALLGEEWLRLYKEQFDRGLKAWEEAEERFFIRRIEWEQDSYRLYSEGQESWLAAFNKFEEERQKWELSAKELFQSGEALFKSISQEFERNIAEAKKEFELNMAMRIGEGTTKVKALIDMYLICASASITAMDNVKYWHNLYNGKNKTNPDDPDFYAWLNEEISRNDNYLLTEIKKSYELYVSYREKALDARDRILSNYAELFGNGALKDILSPEASTEDFCLDEYQIALVRAKALVLYWERKTSIAQAVLSYAGELTSGRMTNAEGLKAWEEAKAAYNESLALYETELSRLVSFGEDIQRQQETLDILSREMQQAEELLSRLNADYSSLVTASLINRGDFYLNELNAKYEILSQQYKLFQQAGDEAVYKNFLEYGMYLDMAGNRENIDSILFTLKNGNGDDIPALSSIESEIDFKIRISCIALFTENSGADWYSKVKGVDLTEEERSSLTGKKLYDRLYDDYKNSLQTLQENQPEDENYYFDYYFNLNLLELFGNYASIIPFAQKEFLQGSLDSLAALFSQYGIIENDNFLPDAHSVVLSILKKPGDFIQNSALFFLEFENCFNFIPEWFENEINGWKEAMLVYIASYAFYLDLNPGDIINVLDVKQAETESNYEEFIAYLNSLEYIDNADADNLNEIFSKINNEFTVLQYAGQITNALERFYEDSLSTENEKHWRQYLTNNYLDDYDSSIAFVNSWKEGVMADLLFNASFFTNRVNDSLTLLLQPSFDFVIENSAWFYNLYLKEAAAVDERFSSLKNLFNDISLLAETYDFLSFSPEDTEEKIQAAYKALKTQEDVHNALKVNYYREVDLFIAKGAAYDEQYSALKRAHENSDQKRFEYEKQDAIQKWAGTAYLGTDHIDIDDYKTKLLRAQTVLSVLSDLYSGENRRAYENPEYDALYTAYEQSFAKKIKILESFEIVSSAISQEYINNEKLYKAYQTELNRLGYVDVKYNDYVSSDNRAEWNIKDIITVKDGRLSFSTNDSWRLSGIDKEKSAELENFFSPSLFPDNERYEISLYENSLRELSERMAGYLTSTDKYYQWSFARDYLLTLLKKANGDLSFLKNTVNGIGELNYNGSLGIQPVQKSPVKKKEHLFSALEMAYVQIGSENTYRKAWEGLTNEEKADLEYYVILTLSGAGNNYLSGFSQVFASIQYKQAFDRVHLLYEYASKNYNNSITNSVLNAFLLPGIGATTAGVTYTSLYYDMMVTNSKTMKLITPVITQTNKKVEQWVNGLNGNFASIQDCSAKYIDSCNKLDVLEGINASNKKIEWEDINFSLLITEKISDSNIAELKIYWDEMQKESSRDYSNVQEALIGMFYWARNKEENNKAVLETYWQNENKKQQAEENIFLAAADDFISGKTSIETLTTYAQNAYGKTAPAWKNHHDNMYSASLNNLSLLLNVNFNTYSEFNILGNEITALTGKILENKYNAELAAREYDWYMSLKDISDKYGDWLNSVSLILESGRSDWNTGFQKIQDSYIKWQINFQNEYSRVSDEWAQAYLAGLEDKQIWLDQAASAADKASTEAFLALVGTEGERMSRFIDTREPFGIRDAYPETDKLMSQLLQSSGITNLFSAFSSINNSVSAASVLVKRGMAGSTWNSALSKIAAADLAKTTNAEIAERETRKIAHSARLAVDEAILSLAANVKEANENFRENMDNHFIMKGLWNKAGNFYVKEVIKGSTLADPIITKRAVIPGYKDYVMEPVTLKTNMDENFLASLDTVAIRGLIENAYIEIQAIGSDIFGNGKSTTINGFGKNINKVFEEFIEESGDDKSKNLEKLESFIDSREQSSGKFGAHLGYAPAALPKYMMGDSIEKMFLDFGDGEIGRLLTYYTYWSVIEGRGNAELTMPAWDKRIWDDTGSSFIAPSLRTSFQIVNAVAAAVVVSVCTYGAGVAAGIGILALSVGINTVDDLIFNAADAAFGYKTWDEAAVEVGRASLINTASAVVSGVFGGIGGAANGGFAGLTNMATTAANTAGGSIAAVMTQTAMTGLQTAATSLTNTVLNSITYSHKDGFGWSNDIFNKGMRGAFTNTLSAMASSFVSGTLQGINTGFDGAKVEGNSLLNKADLSKLNNLAGSLAGEGVNYAMGNDFTLNLLNLSLFTNNKAQSGLLELHLGRNGVSLNFGTGGANISPDNIAYVLRGADVWNTNVRINKFLKNNDDFDSAIALRSLYGFGDSVQKSALWDILKGDAILQTDAEGNYLAETKMVDGKKVVSISGYQKGMSPFQQILLGIVLGHEAYRDGYVTEDNYLETREATLAHTQMAQRMINDGYEFINYTNLKNEIDAYDQGIDYFNTYVDSNYDSSADYWKLVVRNGIAGFEWDGKTTFDLSLLGINERVDQLDDNALMAMWQLGSNKSFEDFSASVNTFYTLNNQLLAFESFLNVDPKHTGTVANFTIHKNNFINALRNVYSSGLFIQTSAPVSELGNEPHVFASGNGIMTSEFGMRIRDWTSENYPFGSFQWHPAWDLSTSGDRSLVAPIAGSLGINFSEGGGLKLVTTGEDDREVSYFHTAGASLRNYITLLSYDTITLNDTGSLSGIAQNMVIGFMGNTGKDTTGAHVHLEYKVGGALVNPGLLFDKSSFAIDDHNYTGLMSGLSNNWRLESFQLNYYQVEGIYNYFNNKNSATALTNFNLVANNSNSVNAHLFRVFNWYQENNSIDKRLYR